MVDVAVLLGVEGVALLDAAEGNVVVWTVDEAGSDLCGVLYLLPQSCPQVRHQLQQQGVECDPEWPCPAEIGHIVGKGEGEGCNSNAEAHSVNHPVHSQ